MTADGHLALEEGPLWRDLAASPYVVRLSRPVPALLQVHDLDGAPLESARIQVTKGKDRHEELHTDAHGEAAVALDRSYELAAIEVAGAAATANSSNHRGSDSPDPRTQ